MADYHRRDRETRPGALSDLSDPLFRESRTPARAGWQTQPRSIADILTPAKREDQTPVLALTESMPTTSPRPLSRAYATPSWLTELIMLLSRSEQDQRIAHWKEHAQTWKEMVTAKCTDRVAFLAVHLDILDRKFGTLLQFQALLPIAITLLLSGLRIVPDARFRVALGIFSLFWLINTVLCLQCLKRLAWGDLWRYRGDPIAGEDDHVNKLVPEIVLRTAEFRIAAAITTFEIILIALLIGIAISLIP